MSDIEDKLMARKETEEKEEKQLKDHEEKLREINDSLRRKNLGLIGVAEGNGRAVAKSDRVAFESFIY